jgi:DNA-binding CsgD family transcriptional regulator
MILLFYVVTLSIIATGCFIFGFHILLKDRNSRINRLFFINSMLLNVVIFITIIIQLPEQVFHVKILQSIYNIVLIAFLAESLYFHLVFTEQKLNPVLKIVLTLSSFIIFAMFLIYGTELLHVKKINGLWVYELVNFKFWFMFYTPLISLITLLMLFYLFRYSRTAVLRKEKNQAKIVMVSILAAFGGGYCFLMIFPVFESYKAPLLTPYFFVIYLYGVFYAMNKYRFLAFSINDIALDILSHIQDIIIILKPDKTIIDANSNLNHLLAGNTEFFTGKSIFEIIEADENFTVEIDELDTGKIKSFSCRLIYKNEPENIVTDSYISKVYDKYGDFAAILIVSRENKGIKQFQRHFKITERELEIIYLAVSGFTNKEVSVKLKISERTVETHFSNIYNRLAINNRIELLRISGDFGINPVQKEFI